MASQAARRHPTRLIAAAVVLVMAGMISHGNFAGSGDPVHYMIIALSLAQDGDLDLEDDYSDPDAVLQIERGEHARPGREGIVRPVHDIGFPVLTAPIVGVSAWLAAHVESLPESLRARAKLDRFIALRQLVSLMMIALTAVTAVLFYRLCVQFTEQRTPAVIWSLLWALSPPILSHGYVYFTEVPSALVAIAVYLRQRRLVDDQSDWPALICGLATGALLLLHVRNAGLALGLTIVVAIALREMPQRLVAFLAGAGTMVLLRLGVNAWLWGTFFSTPHQSFGPWPGLGPFIAEVTVRSVGLLFDVRHGLLFTAPIYLLAPAAWILLRRAAPDLARDVVIVSACYLVFVLMPMTNVHGWRGGWSPAARFLVPIVPFAAAAVPLVLGSIAGRVVAGLVIVVQILINVFFWSKPMLLWNEEPGPSPLLEAAIGTGGPVIETIASVSPVVLAGLAAWTAATWLLSRTGLSYTRTQP